MNDHDASQGPVKPTAARRTCVVTGASGYVGSRLRTCLLRDQWRVLTWNRREPQSPDAARFVLGDEIDPRRLAGVNSLVHCAYDFAPRRWDEIAAVNVAGSRKLLAAACEAGVQSVLVVSTMSAFDGCRSLYGKAKLGIEAVARTFGAAVIRPGLVYGAAPEGMFGRLQQQVRTVRILPLIAGGRQVLYLVHEDDLGAVVCRLLGAEDHPGDSRPITVAHEQGWELREILLGMGRALGRQPRFVSVPWRLAWIGLRSLEMAGVRTSFRSDSLISLVHQDPRPDFSPLKALGCSCRPFAVPPSAP